MRQKNPSVAKEERKLSAIMFTDMVGFMALAQENEELAIEMLEDQRHCVRSVFPRFNGREIKTLGDGFLIEFGTALEAVRCAITIQRKITANNKGKEPRRRFRLRIGVHLGQVVWRNGDVYGTGVNLAARMEPLANPGGICFSQQVYDQVRALINEPIEHVKQVTLKNDSQPRDIYRISFGQTPENESAANPHPPAKSLAVLPFVSLSSDRENEFLSDGITEDLITALSQVAGLRVPASTSVLRFKGAREDIRTIGAQLSVATVLEGSVRRSGNKLRVNAKLISVRDGFNLWSERYDREIEDIFRIQDEITRSIVNALKIRLTGGASAVMVKAPTASTEAYELYVKARHFWNERGEGLKRSLHYFELALLEDPKYDLACAGLADAHLLLGYYGYVPSRNAFAMAKKAVSRALALNPRLPEAHCAAGFLSFMHDWDWPAAERSFRTAIDLKPNYITTYYWYSSCLVAMGRGQEALQADHQALAKDPLSVLANAHLAWTLVAIRDYSAAVQQLKRTLEFDHNFVIAHRLLGQSYSQMGMRKEAVVSFKRAAKLSGRNPSLTAWLAYELGRAGELGKARMVIEEMTAWAAADFVRPYLFALACMGLGEKVDTCRWLQRAYEEQDFWLPWLHLDAAFDPLRNEPAFKNILSKIAEQTSKGQQAPESTFLNQQSGANRPFGAERPLVAG